MTTTFARSASILLALAGFAFAAPAAAYMKPFGEGNGLPPGYAPKDFTVVQKDGVFHLYCIMVNRALRTGGNLGQHLNERRFAHAVSTDLSTWTFVDSAFTVGSGFDRHHVWAPSIVAHGGRYWMFYTGVEDTLRSGSWSPHRMALGVAWSTDLVTWNRSDTPVLRCGPPDLPWTDCAEGGLRDGFVIHADTSGTGQSGWWMFFVTQPRTGPPGGYHDPLAFLVGAATGLDTDLEAWSDFGPNWSTYRPYQTIPGQRTNKVESPHLYKFNNTWYLFFTGDQGIAYLTGGTPVGDIPLPGTEWSYQGRFAELDHAYFASEAFPVTWADGTTEHWFGSVLGGASYWNMIDLRIWNPAAGGPLLADPVTFREIRPLQAAVEHRDWVDLWMEVDEPVVPGTRDQVLIRPAPLEVWEVDDRDGVRSLTPLDPTALSIPRVPKLRTCYGLGDVGDTVRFRPRWMVDDDDTPNRLELIFRCRGTESGVMTVARRNHPVSDAEDGIPEALGLTASLEPGRAAATLRLTMPARAAARLELHDVHGRRVRTLVDRVVEAGVSRFAWDGRDHRGRTLEAGVYFARVRAAGAEARTRVLLVP